MGLHGGIAWIIQSLRRSISIAQPPSEQMFYLKSCVKTQCYRVRPKWFLQTVISRDEVEQNCYLKFEIYSNGVKGLNSTSHQ